MVITIGFGNKGRFMLCLVTAQHQQVGVEQEGDDAEDSVAELSELVKTAGATVVGILLQKRELIHPGTYVGTGKVQEIA